MKDFIPVFQSLVWPVLIAALLFWARRHVRGILDAVRLRIERGDNFEASTSGVKLTSAVRTEDREGRTTTSQKAEITAAEKEGIYLVHKARRDRSMDREGHEFYRIRIFLDTDPDVSLSQVSKVVYHLHPTFREPDRVVSDADAQFELVTYAWGQFGLRADVHIKDRNEPLVLERYLNF